MNAIEESSEQVLDLRTLLSELKHLSKEDKQDIADLASVFQKASEVEPEELSAACKALVEIISGSSANLVRFSLPPAPTTLTKWKEFIASQVTNARKERGMTQVDLAAKTGLPQSHISRIERAKHAPSHLTLCKIANALNIPLSKLDPSAPIED